MEIAILRVLWNLFNPMTSSYKIAKGASLLDCHTIVRYVKPRYANRDGTVDGTTFLSRPVEKGCVSYYWWDFFTGTVEEKLELLRDVLPLNRENKSLFAELNVGNVRQQIRKHIPNMDIIHDPILKSGDCPHCLMNNMPYIPKKGEISPLQEAVIELLSAYVGKNTHPTLQP